MSANHTYVQSEELRAQVHEIQRLENIVEEVRKAEEAASAMIKEMRSRGRQFKASLSADRQRIVSAFQAAEDSVLQSMKTVSDSAQVASVRAQELNKAVGQALGDVQAMLVEKQSQGVSALELYQEARAQFTRSQTHPMYQRFAQDQLESLAMRISQMSSADMSASASQLMSMTILTDIYHMDIEVAKKMAEFDVMFAQAAEAANQLTAYCRNIRNNNREDPEDETSGLLDMDFWTDGRFSQLENELKTIMDRLNSAYDDPTYTTEQLRKDLARLQELTQIERVLAMSSRTEFNKSNLRKLQALTCMDILMQFHHFAVVAHGFDMNDEREAYIVRMRRHTDDAEIEVIVNHGRRDEEFEVYFRIDSTTYRDENVMSDIRGQIRDDFAEAGITMVEYEGCTAEKLEPITSDSMSISETTRRFHGMTRRQKPSSI